MINKKTMLKHEEYLSKYACKDADAIRIDEISEDIRPNYFRDTDRIIYTLSYSRYLDKTQVFSDNKNDHITKRMIHVQFVSKIARCIGRALSLNEDLIEAIALGHDIGHTPYGHLGETYLSELSQEYGEGYFMHNVESVRDLMILENNGKGCNLCIQVYDGILCHNGELLQNDYRPREKTKEEFLDEYYKCYEEKGFANTLVPMTLEGCVVRISDVIGYLGRDIEDAIRLDKIKYDDIPDSIKDILGSHNNDIISHIVNDIIEHSHNKNCISMSKEIYQAISDLKDFNYKYIYSKAMTKNEKENLKNMFRINFEGVLKDIKDNNKNATVFKAFLNDMSEYYLNNTSPERMTIDYIAGMTDEFFVSTYEEYTK